MWFSNSIKFPAADGFPRDSHLQVCKKYCAYEHPNICEHRAVHLVKHIIIMIQIERESEEKRRKSCDYSVKMFMTQHAMPKFCDHGRIDSSLNVVCTRSNTFTASLRLLLKVASAVMRSFVCIWNGETAQTLLRIDQASRSIESYVTHPLSRCTEGALNQALNARKRNVRSSDVVLPGSTIVRFVYRSMNKTFLAKFPYMEKIRASHLTEVFRVNIFDRDIGKWV